jgi:hypothetical protein
MVGAYVTKITENSRCVFGFPENRNYQDHSRDGGLTKETLSTPAHGGRAMTKCFRHPKVIASGSFFSSP